MHRVVKIAALALMGATPARAADTLVPAPVASPYFDAWSFGAGLGLSTDADLFKFTVGTPTVFSVPRGHFGAGIYSLFGDVGAMTFKNIPVKESLRLQPRSALLVAAGLDARNPTPVTQVSVFSQFGLAYLNASDDLATKRGQLGGKLGIGFECVIEGVGSKLTGTDNREALFAEYQMLFGFQRADRLAGEPDLVNGSSFLIGARTYY